MIEVKFTADNVRLIRKAETASELEGLKSLVLERIEQAETVKSFGGVKGKKPVVSGMNWKDVKAIMVTVLGKDLIVPPFPDGDWYRSIYRATREYQMDETYLLKLAKHAKDHMRLPIKMQFLVCQHERVLAGEWNVKKAAAVATAKLPSLPED